MKHFILALFLSASLFALACGGSDNSANTNGAARANVSASPAAPPQPQKSSADEFAAPRSTYNAVCVRCHKENGEGGTVELDKGDTLKVPGFKSGHALKHTDEEYARQIEKGGDGMPAFGKRLSTEQINELVRFIRHEFQKGLPTGQHKSDH